jgi:acetyl-CoA acetyltransferase
MTKTLKPLRPVYVVGIGLHRYQYLSDTPYVTLGLTAVREALTDARLEWRSIQSAYTGTALLGMAASRPMLRHLGTTGIPMAQVENASASGSTAFRQACLDVACGITDVSIAIGVDKHGGGVARAGGKTGIRTLVGSRAVPFTRFALLASGYMNRYGVTPKQIAAVAVKNRRNGSKNPYAQHQRAVTLDEVMAGPAIAGSLTRMQCTPVGEGAAAVIVASDDAIAGLRIDLSRAVRVLASVSRSERVYSAARNHGRGTHARSSLPGL